MGIVYLISIMIALIASACAPEPQSTMEAQFATLTPLPAPTMLPVQATEGDGIGTQGTQVAAATSRECPLDTTGEATRYEIDAMLDWLAHTVRVEQSVRLRNDTEQPLDMVVFNVETNRDEGYFKLQTVKIAGAPVRDYRLEGSQLAVDLPDRLQPGCETAITLKFILTLPAIQDGYNQGHLGYWGYSPRQVNLGMWMPLVAVFEPGRGWINPQFHDVGEHYVLRTADFAVRLSVKNAPDTIRVAGPGVMFQPDDHTWQFEVSGAREVTLSLSDSFKSITTVTSGGVEVVLFYLFNPVSEALDAPRHALYVAADALALYETLYGPYPHKRLVIVEGDFPDGMEFSGLVFVSEAWFRAWRGGIDDWLTIITVHEVAHQWWYGLVGNDQGRYPYLDEALAIYSELLFFEEYYPNYIQWWWEFRVAAYGPNGYVDAPVYDFNGVRAYINAVYLRGAMMMQALRDTLGDDAFFDWIHRYAETMAGRLAYPGDFWGALALDDYTGTGGVRAAYFKQTDVIPLDDQIP